MKTEVALDDPKKLYPGLLRPSPRNRQRRQFELLRDYPRAGPGLRMFYALGGKTGGDYAKTCISELQEPANRRVGAVRSRRHRFWPPGVSWSARAQRIDASGRTR